MTHTIRITGPNIDHVGLMLTVEDVEAARKVLDKVERELDAADTTWYAPKGLTSTCINCGEHVRDHEWGGRCFPRAKAGNES